MLTRLALSLGLPKGLVIALALMLAAGAGCLVWTIWLGAHDRSVVKTHEAEVSAKVERQGRAADNNLADRAAVAREAQSQARKEFDHATAHLPHAGLTDRQRIDACGELRRAGTDPAVLARARCLPAGAAAGAGPAGRDQR